MYWLLSSFATDAQGEYFSGSWFYTLFWILKDTLENVRNGAAFRCIEAIGQAISYGMNTQTTNNPLVGLYVFSVHLYSFAEKLADWPF